MEVSVLSRVVPFYQHFFTIRPVKQTVRHGQGHHVLELWLLRVLTEVQDLSAVQGDRHHGVLTVMGNQQPEVCVIDGEGA